MTSLIRVSVVVLMLVLALGPVLAADTAKPVTMQGKIACAMCVLKHKDAKACAPMLVVTENGKDVEYALANNDVMKAFGHDSCEKAIAAKVTGTLAESNGKKVLTATKIERV